MMFGEWLHFGSNKKFLLNKALIVQIFKKKWHFSKRVAKVGFYLAQKKALANKYLLIIGEARSMFGKFEMLKPDTELNFCLWRDPDSKKRVMHKPAQTQWLIITRFGNHKLQIAFDASNSKTYVPPFFVFPFVF